MYSNTCPKEQQGSMVVGQIILDTLQGGRPAFTIKAASINHFNKPFSAFLSNQNFVYRMITKSLENIITYKIGSWLYSDIRFQKFRVLAWQIWLLYNIFFSFSTCTIKIFTEDRFCIKTTFWMKIRE